MLALALLQDFQKSLMLWRKPREMKPSPLGKNLWSITCIGLQYPLKRAMEMSLWPNGSLLSITLLTSTQVTDLCSTSVFMTQFHQMMTVLGSSHVCFTCAASVWPLSALLHSDTSTAVRFEQLVVNKNLIKAMERLSVHEQTAAITR
jgi:hypothetical protein